VFNLVHWQKASNNTRPPDTAELRWKSIIEFLYYVANNIIVLLLYCWPRQDTCIFNRFKVSCEVMPLHSFANFKFIMDRHRMELRRAQKVRCPRPWPMRKSITDHSTTYQYFYTLQYVEKKIQFFGKLKQPHGKAQKATVWPPLVYSIRIVFMKPSIVMTLWKLFCLYVTNNIVVHVS